MEAYLLIFISVIIFSGINMRIEKEKLKNIYIIYGIILVIFIGLRKDLGGIDYEVYTEYFKGMTSIFNMSNWNYPDVFEVGFKYFVAIIKTITENPYVMFSLVTILTVPVLLIINYKYCKYPFFTLSFYIYKTMLYTNFIAIRQSISLTIFLISIKYIFSGDFKKYMILIFLATIFHSSAIVLLPLYLIRYVKLYKLGFLKVISIGILISVFSDLAVKMFLYIGNFINLSDNLLEKMRIYSQAIDSGINLHLVEIIILYFIFFWIYEINNNEEEVISSIFVLYVILIISFGKYLIFIRISMYFYFFIMILMSKWLDRFNYEKYKESLASFGIKIKFNISNNKLKIIVMYLLCIVFLLGYINYLIKFDNGGLLPYRTLLFN